MSDLDRLLPALKERAAELAEYLLGPPNAQFSTEEELRWGNHGSLSLVIAGPKTGLFSSHEDGEGGDLFDLIRRVHGCGFRKAVEIASDFIDRPAVIHQRREMRMFARADMPNLPEPRRFVNRCRQSVRWGRCPGS